MKKAEEKRMQKLTERIKKNPEMANELLRQSVGLKVRGNRHLKYDPALGLIMDYDNDTGSSDQESVGAKSEDLEMLEEELEGGGGDDIDGNDEEYYEYRKRQIQELNLNLLLKNKIGG